MATGPGYVDTQGVYFFGEDDGRPLFSDTLNLLSDSISKRLAQMALGAPVWGALPKAVGDWQILQATTWSAKVNGICYVSLDAQLSKGTVNSGYHIMTLPSTHCPPTTQTVIGAASGAGAGPAVVTIGTDGVVRVWSASANNRVSLQANWRM